MTVRSTSQVVENVEDARQVVSHDTTGPLLCERCRRGWACVLVAGWLRLCLPCLALAARELAIERTMDQDDAAADA
jgi:hypothetical protein